MIDIVAKGIEKARAKSIPILLGFLASLLGISGKVTKAGPEPSRRVIKACPERNRGKIRKKVDKFTNK